MLTPLDATLLADAHARLPLTHDGLSIAHDAGKLAFCGKFEPFGKSSMLERGDLMSILRDALKGRGVEVQYGKKVVHVEDGSEGWFALQRRWSGKRKGREGVVVSTEQGDEVRCDFVIGRSCPIHISLDLSRSQLPPVDIPETMSCESQGVR